MSTLALTRALSSLFVPIGMIGAGLAIICAIVIDFAIARGAAGLAGGAAGVWIVGAMLSLTASFATQWIPLIVALAALAVALVVGLMARGAVFGVRSMSARAAEATDAVAEPAKPASRSQSTESIVVA